MNIQDISNRPFDGLKVEKLLKNNQVETLMIMIEQGHELPNHTTSKEALLIMHQGEAVFYINQQEILLTSGITFTIPVNQVHSVKAKKDSILFIIR